MQDARISHEERRDARFYLFRNVPAHKCANCGEIWIGESTLREIDRLIREGTPSQTVETPLFDFPLAKAS